MNQWISGRTCFFRWFVFRIFWLSFHFFWFTTRLKGGGGGGLRMNHMRHTRICVCMDMEKRLRVVPTRYSIYALVRKHVWVR